MIENNAKNDQLDEVKMATDVQNYLQAVVNRAKRWLINFNASKTILTINHLRDASLLSVNMADANLQKRHTLCLLTFSAEMK